MRTLLFDTETDGIGNKRLVQLGMVLVDEHWRTLMEADLLVKPEGFVIPSEATAVHGIAHDTALAMGGHLADALGAFYFFASMADRWVCHNLEFDLEVMSGEFRRVGELLPEEPAETFCTMQHMTEVCRIPGRRPGQYKWPRLAEAYRHAFGEGFDGAHNALADVKATLRLFRWIHEQYKHVPEPCV